MEVCQIQKTKVRTTISPLQNNNTGKLTENDKEQADVLVKQFASVMVEEPDGDIPQILRKELKTLPLQSINIRRNGLEETK